MPISTLVLTARHDPRPLLEALNAHPAFFAPSVNGRRVGVVLDTRDETANRAACRWLRERPDVVGVDVVHVVFEHPSSSVPSGVDA